MEERERALVTPKCKLLEAPSFGLSVVSKFFLLFVDKSKKICPGHIRNRKFRHLEFSL